jgi:hypothetical protein
MLLVHVKPCFVPRTIRRTMVLPLMLSAVAGCAETQGDVSGQVSFKGSPLPAGKVTFLCEGGAKPVLTANIREGKYEIKGVPVGPVKITVATYKPSKGVERPPGLGPTARPGPEEAPPSPPEKYVAIPLRYGHANESQLTCDVKAGTQEHDIALTP